MLNSKGFDLWADGYDKAVGISDEDNSYPFAGYKEVLGRIFRIVMEKAEHVNDYIWREIENTFLFPPYTKTH